MGEKTLIATYYSFEPFVAAFHEFVPQRVKLIVAKDTLKKIEEHLTRVNEVYGKISKIEVIEVNGSDVYEIAKTTVGLLEKYKSDTIFVNVSGGWKLLAQGVLYGCYVRSNLVSKIVCNNLQDNSVLELPKFRFEFSGSKFKILETLSKRNGDSISEIAKKVGKSKAMVYQHLDDLKDGGYVDSEYNLTMAGKIALL